MIFDSHVHLDDTGLKIYQKANIGALVNADSGSQLLSIRKEHPHVFVSFGVHPWKVKEIVSATHAQTVAETIEGLREYYRQAHAIGEIGMDSTWCEVELRLQRDVFCAQLHMAKELSKPVVLHVKGQEKEVAQMIKECPVHKLVHWYSCNDYLEEYLSQDCYFTIGPDYNRNSAVRALIERVPLTRLLVETDGLDAARWALNRDLSQYELPQILSEAMKEIATIKQVTYDEAEKMLGENLHRFLF